MALQASQAHRHLRQVTGTILVLSAAVAILHLFIDRGLTGTGVMAVVNGLLYLAAPVIIVHHLLL